MIAVLETSAVSVSLKNSALPFVQRASSSIAAF
jgi:hypothetical protein